MKTPILSIVIAISILTFGCKQKSEKQTESKEVSENINSHNHGDHEHGNSSIVKERNIDASTQKSDATTAIVDAYLQIKNALVSNSKDDAAKGATELLSAFSKFDMSKLTESQHKEYMEILENSKEQAEHIKKSPVDHQREHFEVLSIDMYDLIMLLGTKKTLYQFVCPTTNNGKGVMWLSEEREIKNPYSGNKKPNCGEIQKQIN